MSLLDDPNPDIFINEIAAKQKKKIKMNMKKLLKNILLCLLIIQNIWKLLKKWILKLILLKKVKYLNIKKNN